MVEQVATRRQIKAAKRRALRIKPTKVNTKIFHSFRELGASGLAKLFNR